MSVVNQTAKRDVTVSKDALLKSYSKRLKDDVRSLADNFSSIVKTCRYTDTCLAEPLIGVLSGRYRLVALELFTPNCCKIVGQSWL